MKKEFDECDCECDSCGGNCFGKNTEGCCNQKFKEMKKEFDLSEERKKLLDKWLEPRDGCEREMFIQVFHEIAKQDKEFIKRVEELPLKCIERGQFNEVYWKKELGRLARGKLSK